MFALPSAPKQAARCRATTRFPVEGCIVVVQCIGERNHSGDCTMLDPNSYQPVRMAQHPSRR